jgi:AcrR family transcriptional regulator
MARNGNAGRVVSGSADASRIAMRRKAALAEGSPDYLAKRADLIKSAAAVFSEKGYNSATLNDVAARFGTDRASLYYYVGSKEELFQECIKGVLDDNLAAGQEIVDSSATSAEKLAQLVRVVLTSYQVHYPYMYLYIQEQMSRVASETAPWAKSMAGQTHRFEKLFLRILDEGVADGSFRSDLSLTLVVNALFGMLNWTHRWYVPGRKYSADDLARTFLAVFFDGIDKR